MSGARASGRIRGRTISAPRAEISVVPAAAGSELPCASHPEHVRVNLVVSGADSLPGGFLEGGAPGSLGRSAGRTAEPICCQWRRQNPLRVPLALADTCRGAPAPYQREDAPKLQFSEIPGPESNASSAEVRRQRLRAGAAGGRGGPRRRAPALRIRLRRLSAYARCARRARASPPARLKAGFFGEEPWLRLAPALQEGAEAHAAAPPLLGAV